MQALLHSSFYEFFYLNCNESAAQWSLSELFVDKYLSQLFATVFDVFCFVVYTPGFHN